jgi:ATP-dependent Lon protease
MNDPTELPLFPLDNVVLFPFKRLPIHIFEDRYKQMINTCLDDETEFGIVWGNDDDFREVGSAALVTDLVTRFSDGRMNVITQGTRRFRVLERLDIHPYITGIVEEVDDEPEMPDLALSGQVQDLYREALKLSLGWFKPKKEEDVDLSELSYVVAASLNLPLPEQQTILEMRSVNGRLEAISKILAEALKGIREVKRRTGGNGHLE